MAFFRHGKNTGGAVVTQNRRTNCIRLTDLKDTGNDTHNRVMDRIRRYHQGLPSEATQKRRKTTRYIVFINVMLLLFLLYLYNRSTPVETAPLTVEFGNGVFQIFTSKNSELRQLVFSMTVRSTGDSPQALTLSNPPVTTTIMHRKDIVHEIRYTVPENSITMKSGDTRKFIMAAPESAFSEFAARNPDSLVPPRKTFLSRKQFLPVNIVHRINTKIPIAIHVPYSYAFE